MGCSGRSSRPAAASSPTDGARGTRDGLPGAGLAAVQRREGLLVGRRELLQRGDERGLRVGRRDRAHDLACGLLDGGLELLVGRLQLAATLTAQTALRARDRVEVLRDR